MQLHIQSVRRRDGDLYCSSGGILVGAGRVRIAASHLYRDFFWHRGFWKRTKAR
jgi:hypothetical protein